jgi:hypothetical protein
VTAERYTAVFTGLLSLKKPGEYLYVRMRENLCGAEGYTMSRGRPPYGELGRAASFGDLPGVAGDWCWAHTGRCGICSVTKPGVGGI